MKKNIDDFFNEPVPQHISNQVNFEVQIIDKFVEFGEWLMQNYIINVDNSGERFWRDHLYAEYTTDELFAIWNSKE